MRTFTTKYFITNWLITPKTLTLHRHSRGVALQYEGWLSKRGFWNRQKGWHLLLLLAFSFGVNLTIYCAGAVNGKTILVLRFRLLVMVLWGLLILILLSWGTGVKWAVIALLFVYVLYWFIGGCFGVVLFGHLVNLS